MTEQRWTIYKLPAKKPTANRPKARGITGPDTEPIEVVPAAERDTLREQVQNERCIAHGAFSAEGDCVFCDVEQAREEVRTLREQVGELREALGFYADLPRGSVIEADDYSETEIGVRPGKRARAALTPTQPPTQEPE